MFNTQSVQEIRKEHAFPIRLFIEKFSKNELETIVEDPAYYLFNDVSKHFLKFIATNEEIR